MCTCVCLRIATYGAVEKRSEITIALVVKHDSWRLTANALYIIIIIIMRLLFLSIYYYYYKDF